MMKFDKNLAAIHAYLCGDGYVIKNPETQKHKYYRIGFRNTNKVLLEDFQQKFFRVFGLKPIITNEGRSKIENKWIYEFLTKEYSYYSYEWELPKLNKQNLSYWLRAFFDCEGWVENNPKKSHRVVRLDCCNESGLLSIHKALLETFDINSSVKKRLNRTIWRLTICGCQNIKSFQKYIGFLHPMKDQRLKEALESFHYHLWKIPKDKFNLLSFVRLKGKLRASRNEINILSIKKKNLTNLQKALKEYNVPSTLLGPWKSSTCSQYYCLKIKEESTHGERTN